MAHANAALTPIARLRLGKLIVEDGWPVARAAERFQVSWPTAKRWAERYLESGCEAGVADMQDRSSRPHRCPHTTPAPVLRKIVHLRWKQLSRASSFSPLAARSSPHWWPGSSPRRRPDNSPPSVVLGQLKAVTPLPEVAWASR